MVGSGIGEALQKARDHRRAGILCRTKQQQDDHHAGEEVHGRAGHTDGKPPGQTGLGKAALGGQGALVHRKLLLACEQLFGVLVLLALHHDGTAQRQQPDGIQGLAHLFFENGRAETDGKLQNGNARKLGNDEMAKLVNKDQQSEYKDRDDIAHEKPPFNRKSQPPGPAGRSQRCRPGWVLPQRAPPGPPAPPRDTAFRRGSPHGGRQQQPPHWHR